MADDVAAKLAEAKARQEVKAQVRAHEQAARELKLIELEEQYEKELGGPVGTAFAIVDTAEGPVVLKHGAVVLFKRLRDGSKDTVTFDALQSFVAPCVVFPDKVAFAAMVEARAGILVRCSDALIALYRGQEDADRGKY